VELHNNANVDDVAGDDDDDGGSGDDGVVMVAVAGADARLEEDKREPTHGDRAQS